MKYGIVFLVITALLAELTVAAKSKKPLQLLIVSAAGGLSSYSLLAILDILEVTFANALISAALGPGAAALLTIGDYIL